jgi:hypothetical protein
MTQDEIKRIMIEVIQAIDDASVPDDLRVAAFEKTFDALLTPVVSGVRPAADSFPGRQSPQPTGAAGPSLGAIASKLGLDAELVEEIYYVDGDNLGLAVAASRFDSKKAGATQEIALLLAAGRQAGGWDEWTPVSRVRDVCREYGRFDPANFATTVKRMGSVFSFRGKAREVEVRVTRPGYEQAANLARELGGV